MMNLSKSFRSGFTLIELLVVVAIIGVLASVVLASLNSARAKGADSAIKANLANIRPQAEFLYSENGAYDVDTTATAFAAGACAATAATMFANATIWGQITAATNASGGLNACMVATTTGGSWSVMVQLKQYPLTEGWCVDSSGASKKMTLDGAPIQADLNALITDGTNAKCD